MATETAASDAEGEALDRELDFGRIADLLAQLSESCPVPTAAVPQDEPVPFLADEVKFETNDWLQRLVAIQGWIRLDATLTPGTLAKDLAAQLYGQLAVDQSADCFAADEGGNVQPTALGIQVLEEHLARAAQYKQTFSDALDEDRTLKDASAEWLQNWEDDEAPPRPPISITAEVAQWRIKDFKENAEEGRLDLNPSYQRDIVWSTTESQMLIESILRGIPLPSVILSESSEGNWQIVDGKQRLTAILRFIGRHPDGRAYAEKVNDIENFDKNFRKFARKQHLKPADIAANYLPFKLKTFKENDPLLPLSGRYYYEIKQEKLRIGGQECTIREAFESIGSRYQVPVLLYRNTEINDIHHVFGLYNKQGKKLNAEEVRNAVYHHVPLMRLLLVLSGDRPSPDELAEYLPEQQRVGIRGLGTLLTEYNFGTSRFKRTKVLSWMSAILLQQPNSPGGQLATPSTAAHINAMLTEERSRSHPLGGNDGLIEFARVVEAAIRLHVDHEIAWAPTFRNKKGNQSKWEELPLIGSLLAAVIVVSVKMEGAFIQTVEKVRAVSETLKSPEKTQNRTQWQHIAKTTLQLIAAVGVDLAQAGKVLQQKYGYNCIPVLQKLAA